MSKITYISLGENCLIDEILKDFKLRKETFPFGSGRFNIEYISAICHEGFEHFLDDQHLQYAIVENIQVVKNTYYAHQDDIYESTVCDHVEFTHHDVLQPSIKDSMQRKVERFKDAIRHPQQYVFLYYYRYSLKRDVKRILSHLENWITWTEAQSGITPKLIFIHQDIVATPEERKFQIRAHSWGKEVCFYTQGIWTGNDNWAAAPDRDLFEQFLNNNEMMRFIYEQEWRQEKWRRHKLHMHARLQKIKSALKNWIRSLIKN